MLKLTKVLGNLLITLPPSWEIFFEGISYYEELFFFLSYEMILEFSENWSETVLEFWESFEELNFTSSLLLGNPLWEAVYYGEGWKSHC